MTDDNTHGNLARCNIATQLFGAWSANGNLASCNIATQLFGA